MSSGKIWSGILPANANQDTGVTPAGKVRTVNITVVNLGSSSCTLKVYISTAVDPAAADRIEPDIVIPANGLYKLSGEPVGPGERVVLHPSSSITARLSGFEEVA